MPKIIDKNELLKLNPHVNRDLLKESMLITQLLEESGVKMSDYNLASPFSRRRAKKDKSNCSYKRSSKKAC
jgi:hypothetical protein